MLSGLIYLHFPKGLHFAKVFWFTCTWFYKFVETICEFSIMEPILTLKLAKIYQLYNFLLMSKYIEVFETTFDSVKLY